MWKKYVRTGKMQELYQALEILSEHPGLKYPYFNNVDYLGLYYVDEYFTFEEAVSALEKLPEYQESMFVFSIYNEDSDVLHDVGFNNGYVIDQHTKIPVSYKRFAARRIFSINKVEKFYVNQTGEKIIAPISFDLIPVDTEKLKRNAELNKKDQERFSAREDRRSWLSNNLDDSLPQNAQSDNSKVSVPTPSGTIIQPKPSGINTDHLPKSTADIPSLEDLLAESLKSPTITNSRSYNNHDNHDNLAPELHEVATDAKFIYGKDLGFPESDYKTITGTAFLSA